MDDLSNVKSGKLSENETKTPIVGGPPLGEGQGLIPHSDPSLGGTPYNWCFCFISQQFFTYNVKIVHFQGVLVIFVDNRRFIKK